MNKKRFLTTVLLFLAFAYGYAQSDFFSTLADSALTLTKQRVTYDPGYYAIKYPNGDVPANIGVCTDVVIRLTEKWASICRKKFMWI